MHQLNDMEYCHEKPFNYLERLVLENFKRKKVGNPPWRLWPTSQSQRDPRSGPPVINVLCSSILKAKVKSNFSNSPFFPVTTNKLQTKTALRSLQLGHATKFGSAKTRKFQHSTDGRSADLIRAL